MHYNKKLAFHIYCYCGTYLSTIEIGVQIECFESVLGGRPSLPYIPCRVDFLKSIGFVICIRGMLLAGCPVTSKS